MNEEVESLTWEREKESRGEDVKETGGYVEEASLTKLSYSKKGLRDSELGSGFGETL